MSEKQKVLIFGTHPNQYNGYSKVVYELISCLANKQDLDITVYGFQRFGDQKNHRANLPSNVNIYDAFEKEEPKNQGFGIEQIREFVKNLKPDICIVYNDMMIIHQVITKLKLCQNEDKLNFKIIAYIDQVYLNQKKEFIEFINKTADFALLFTKYWEKNIVDQGISIPHDNLPHGFNKDIYYPIPKKLARQFYNVPQNDFVILNLNRNQPRKRWDICLKAFAEIVSRYPNEPIKLMIGTALNGGWNLIEIFERELKKRNCSIELGMKHLIIMDRPQKSTDEDTNILYNVADIGINTCDGEGFGLCNFEQAAVGVPQIVPNLGGFMDFFDESNSMMIEPTMAYYVDHSRDIVAGEALLCNYIDYVEAFETYYQDRKLIESHGKNARERILKNYKWTDLSDKLYNIIYQVLDKKIPIAPSVETLIKEVEKIEIKTVKKEGKLTQKRKKEIQKLQARLKKLTKDNDNTNDS